MGIGVPDVVGDLFGDDVFGPLKSIAELFVAARRMFGNHDDAPAAPAQSPLDRTNAVLNAPPPAAPVPPPAPNGQSGLNTGATDAGSQYDDSVNAAQLTDQKLAEMLKHIFASNQAARDKVSAILAEIASKQKLIAPEMGDPASVTAFGQFLDQKFAEVQKILSDAQVDAKTQAAILDALGDEYRANGPNTPDGPPAGNAAPGTSADPGAGSNAAAEPESAPVAATGPAGADQSALMDPLAGMGMTPMGMDPLSALSGLGSLPGAMSGLGATSPLDALGPALSALAPLGGLASGFSDEKPAQDEKPSDGFTDEPAQNGKPASSDPPATHKDDPSTQAASATQPNAPAGPAQHTPEEAAPQSAPVPGSADAARNVRMPDGQVVTAPDAQSAQVMRSVLGGTSVTDAFKQVGVDLPPPGTPVTDPVDPSVMPPGSVGRFESREPVMAMGNGKIWMDGQLQPISALGSTTDFLGWSKPPTQAGAQAAVSAGAPTGAPPAAT